MDGEYERLLLLPLLTFLIRSILHDPKSFNNPMKYQPERYLKDGRLNPDVIDPASVAFGYGRRSVIDPIYFSDMDLMVYLSSICPGRHLADNILYSIVSSLLAVYDIKPPAEGLKPEFSGQVVS